MRPVIATNGDPFLQMRSVGSHSTSGREKEGIKERMGDGSPNEVINNDNNSDRYFNRRMVNIKMSFPTYKKLLSNVFTVK